MSARMSPVRIHSIGHFGVRMQLHRSASATVLTAVALCVMVCSSSTPATAGPFTPGNIVCTTDYVSEYSPAGVEVQYLTFTPEGDWPQRGSAFDRDGRLQVFCGTENPRLTTYDPVNNTWTHHSAPEGWNSAWREPDGNVACFENYVFVNDRSGGLTRGVIRFDIDDNYSIGRALPNVSTADVTMGYDGWLYVTDHTLEYVHVVDPHSLAFIRPAFRLARDDIEGIAVNADGHIFAASADGMIYHFDGYGSLIDSVDSGLANPMDIELSPTGEIVVGGFFEGDGGEFVITDETLDTVSTPRPTRGGFVTWVPIPEPSSLALCGIGGLALLFRRRA